MIVHLDIVWVFVLNAAVTMAFVIVLGRLKLAPREAPPPRGAMLAQMRDGLAFILAEPALRTILAVLLTGGLLVRSVLELVPAIAAETFASAATGLAVLTGAAAAGAVVSGLTVRDRDAGTLLRGVLIWWAIGAVAAILMTQAPDHWLAVPAAVLLGAAITRGLVGTQTYVQLATPDALRGRVLSFHGLIARGSPAIGALAIGYGADRLGLPVSVTAASVALLLVVGAIALASRG